MAHVQIEGMGSLEHGKGRIRNDAFIVFYTLKTNLWFLLNKVPTERFLPNIFQITWKKNRTLEDVYQEWISEVEFPRDRQTLTFL